MTHTQAAWLRNSLRHRIDEMRNLERRARSVYTKGTMLEPATVLADVYRDAAAVFERALLAVPETAPKRLMFTCVDCGAEYLDPLDDEPDHWCEPREDA